MTSQFFFFLGPLLVNLGTPYAGEKRRRFWLEPPLPGQRDKKVGPSGTRVFLILILAHPSKRVGAIRYNVSINED